MYTYIGIEFFTVTVCLHALLSSVQYCIVPYCSYISTSSTTSTLRLPLYILSAVSAYQKAYGTGKKRDAARYLCTVKSEKFKFK